MMTFEDPKLEEYFRTLPEDVQRFLNSSGKEICSLGELMLVGEHLRNSFGHPPEEESGERKQEKK